MPAVEQGGNASGTISGGAMVVTTRTAHLLAQLLRLLGLLQHKSQLQIVVEKVLV